MAFVNNGKGNMIFVCYSLTVFRIGKHPFLL